MKIANPFVVEITGTVPQGAGRVARRVCLSVTQAEISLNTDHAALLAEKLYNALHDLGGIPALGRSK